MKNKTQLILISSFLCTAFLFISAVSPYNSWKTVEKVKIQKFKGEVIFFDHLIELTKQLNGSKIADKEMIQRLQDIHFTYPLYVARLEKKKEFMYYILRADQEKSQSPFFFEVDVVRSSEEIQLYQLLDRANYQDKLLETLPAKACRGELIYEDMEFVQRQSNKDKLVGNGIQLIPGLFTRVIPAKETKEPFIDLIESDLAKR